MSQSNDVVLMVGPSGAGKSTWVRDNYSLTPDAIVCPDTYRRILTGEVRSQGVNDKVWSICKTIVYQRVRFGLPAVVDATNIKTKDRVELVKLVQHAAAVWGLDSQPVIRYVVVDRPLKDKLESRGWRPAELIRRHADIFNSNLKYILAGDNIKGVVVVDTRVSQEV